jgi:choice-of-anchor B domain-containing protein
MGSVGNGNDIWGWTSPDGEEVAIACSEDGTSFVDVSDPVAPVFLGFLPTHTAASPWRDVKVYKDHAYIVSEAEGHGMQILDLAILKGKRGAVLAETAFYGEHGSSHNIVINEDTGFAYSVGTKTCKGGLHMIDLKEPARPTFAGCYAEDGYTHDAQCVVYAGPDTAYNGAEICFNYNEDSLTIVDVSDKSAPVMISRKGYEGSQYTHQGWLTKDSRYAIMNDELDEVYNDNKHTRTMIWDVSSLADPHLDGSFYSEHTAIDHNLYIKGDLVFETNYCAGLRILDARSVAHAKLEEVAYFDVAPDCDTTKFRGSWSSYPYFKSGVVVVQSIERGLFVLKPHINLLGSSR